MARTVYLGGGGSAEEERQLWDVAFVLPLRILYWPFALEQARHAAAEQWVRTHLGRFGSFDVEVWSGLADHQSSELDRFDLLFVGGGNTYQLLDEVRKFRFIEPVRQFVDSGGAYYGGSAGALLAGLDIAIDEESRLARPDLTDSSALGLVGLVACPHYTHSREVETSTWAQRHGYPVLGIPERAGAAVVDAQVHSIGPEPLYLFDGSRTRVIPSGSAFTT